MKGILGRKVGMTQVFDEQGLAVPVTIIEAGPCFVTQVKTEAKDGYSAIQLGYQETKVRKLSNAEWMRLRKNNLPALRHLREIRVDNVEQYEVGQKVRVNIFEKDELVDVKGTSKGKGFAGAVKRYGFRGGPRTHGQSDRLRAVGAISSGSTPGWVGKGKRMPGHMGHEKVTVQRLQVVMVDLERNLLAVKGSVPGANNGLLVIHSTTKPQN